MKYFKNVTGTSADFYVYGEIVDEKVPDWFTGETSETEVDPSEFKNELDELEAKGIKDFNIYINSPGGSVFAASTIVSLIKRFATNSGAKIHSFIDGLCASAATYLCMVADDINVYKNSIMMIHKPMTFSMGNADDLQKDIDVLNTLEDNTMIPMYADKAKVDKKELKQLIADETWFNGNEEDKMFIGNFFNINMLDETKKVTACSSRLLKNYKHVPEALDYARPKAYEEETKSMKAVEKVVENDEKQSDESVEKSGEKLDYSEFDDTIKLLKH